MVTRRPLLPGNVLFSRPKKCVRQGFENRPGFCLVGYLCFPSRFIQLCLSSDDDHGSIMLVVSAGVSVPDMGSCGIDIYSALHKYSPPWMFFPFIAFINQSWSIRPSRKLRCCDRTNSREIGRASCRERVSI